jgi:hypothetical protein
MLVVVAVVVVVVVLVVVDGAVTDVGASNEVRAGGSRSGLTGGSRRA